ncbi:uncharacterized protein LOC133038369 [Cannabis sativa]|uniref:uncharacterized protein LOC133038369 n=1 Tax=Cannabis sativa TaxID=3483 RepID=UPI0029CA96D3|nr:uncharacterized protein LOC133038369 [Cannabis sativa]
MNEIILFQAEKGGRFKAKYFYTSLIKDEKVEYCSNVWNKLVIPKHRYTYWKAINNLLLTRNHLIRFICISSSLCPVCEIEEESHDHLFMECIFTKKVVEDIYSWLGFVNWPKTRLDLVDWCSKPSLGLKEKVINTVIASTIYIIWKNRNRCVFDNCCSLVNVVSKEIKFLVKWRILRVITNVKKDDNYIIRVVESW